MKWFRRRLTHQGFAVFRGAPALPESMQDLLALGIRMERAEPTPDARWVRILHHDEWGKATLVCPVEPVIPPRVLIEHEYSFSAQDRETALGGESTLHLVLEGRKENIVSDRKILLRFLRAVLGPNGLFAVDVLSQRLWSRAALDEELAHEAELDITGLFTLHSVYSEQEESPIVWLHSHGLAEMGAVDFDILNPCADLLGTGFDSLRAIAFALVEGRAGPTTSRFCLAHPGGDVRFVEVDRFNRKADPSFAALRDTEDPSHGGKRVVVCDPPRGILARWRAGLTGAAMTTESISGSRWTNSMTIPWMPRSRARRFGSPG